MLSDRARQRRQERKRRRREEHRRELRRGPAPLPAAAAEMMALPPMSDTLIAFAAPLLEILPEEAPLHAREGSLLLASLVWNDVNRALADGATSWWAAWRRRSRTARLVATGTGVPRSTARELVHTLEERKRALFPHDRRLVLDVRARPRRDGEVRVEALSALPT